MWQLGMSDDEDSNQSCLRLPLGRLSMSGHSGGHAVELYPTQLA